MDLSLKNLVRTGTTAKCTSVHVQESPDRGSRAVFLTLDFVTSDGFRFTVPGHNCVMSGTAAFPLEGKAIEYLKWIRGEVGRLQANQLEEEMKELVR